METKSHKDIKFLQYIAIGLGIIGFIILFYFIIVLTRQKIIDFKLIDLGKFSAFGDFIGGLVGSIWALAGVLLFYVALVYQRRELDETIKSRDDLTLAYNKQIEAAEFQKFQTLFFNLYVVFVNIRESLRKPDEDYNKEKQLPFQKLYRDIINFFRVYNTGNGQVDYNNLIKYLST